MVFLALKLIPLPSDTQGRVLYVHEIINSSNENLKIMNSV